MPLLPYNGETFVAFLDISGFKALMKNGDRALVALNTLYQAGYDTIRDGTEIEGIFVSDCGILFVRHTNNQYRDLTTLLDGIKRINRRLLQENFITVTSIAYGNFRYQNKIEIQGIEKNAIYGGAYVDAFLDLEKSNPKIKAGQVRLLINNLPQQVLQSIENRIDGNAALFKKKGNHYYYYWTIENPGNIDRFDDEYSDSYNLVYQGILTTLKKDY